MDGEEGVDVEEIPPPDLGTGEVVPRGRVKDRVTGLPLHGHRHKSQHNHVGRRQPAINAIKSNAPINYKKEHRRAAFYAPNKSVDEETNVLPYALANAFGAWFFGVP
jgi:hypothetical protein